MMCFACLDQLSGGSSVFVDENDDPSMCRLAPVGDSLVVAESPADLGKSRFRQIDLFMVEAGGPRFRLDTKQRLASVRATSLARPEDWHLALDRLPAVWFGYVTIAMLAVRHTLPLPPAATPSGGSRSCLGCWAAGPQFSTTLASRTGFEPVLPT